MNVHLQPACDSARQWPQGREKSLRNLSDTVARLSAIRAASGIASGFGGVDRLTDLPGFGSNPGALRARAYVPESLSAHAPLVVVLHGCTQNAAGYDHAAGWSRLADRHGFALLLPEQQRQNNPNLCFNWFAPQHARRDSGEALSILQMVAAMVAAHSLDPARIYVTGLSAGGAMTSVMLATYPEVFAGGAIIAGLPFGTASSVPEAFDRMRGHGSPDEPRLTALVRNASEHGGPWPTISVWHGSADATVAHANAEAIVSQWRDLHGVNAGPSRVETIDGHPRRIWADAAGREVIEEYSIAGMGHGTPLATQGADAVSVAAPYMLEAGISSTEHIARFWGLLDDEAHRPATAPVAGTAARPPEARILPLPLPATSGPAKVIEDALRAAGLMR
jgi:poly(hydroxyalkanoate) depolymerase family esterase